MSRPLPACQSAAELLLSTDRKIDWECPLAPCLPLIPGPGLLLNFPRNSTRRTKLVLTLPIERDAHHGPMLHDVQGVLAEPTILAEIDG